jgi:hypothetical protein
MSRAVTVEQILKMNFKEMEFTGNWQRAIGTPELSGVWIVWGHSGNGKTRFSMQLAKYLTQFGKVLYNSLEEGARKSMRLAIEESNMLQAKSKFILLNRESMEDLRDRLNKKAAPKIVFIDSFQYAALSKKDYIKLKEEFPTVLFIFISHAEGQHPEGRVAKFVRYDADVKIRVEGFKALCQSRYGGGEPYIIWLEGANQYWAENQNDSNDSN